MKLHVPLPHRPRLHAHRSETPAVPGGSAEAPRYEDVDHRSRHGGLRALRSAVRTKDSEPRRAESEFPLELALGHAPTTGRQVRWRSGCDGLGVDGPPELLLARPGEPPSLIDQWFGERWTSRGLCLPRLLCRAGNLLPSVFRSKRAGRELRGRCVEYGDGSLPVLCCQDASVGEYPRPPARPTGPGAARRAEKCDTVLSGAGDEFG